MEPARADPYTLGYLQRNVPGKWVWLYCERYGCPHNAPAAIAHFVIRWGPDAGNTLRRSARC